MGLASPQRGLTAEVLGKMQLVPLEKIDAVYAKKYDVDLPQPPVRYLSHSKSTRHGHYTMLEKVIEIFKCEVQTCPELAQVNLTSFLLFVLFKQKQASTEAGRGWSLSTFKRNMTALHGALAQLSLYTTNSSPILLKHELDWTEMLDVLSRLAREAPRNESTAATWEQVKEAIDKETNTTVQMALLVQWATAGRVGDTSQIKRRDISLDMATGNLSVTIRRGKTVAVRGAWTVETRILNEDLRRTLHRYMQGMPPERRVCYTETDSLDLASSAHTARINKALKRVAGADPPLTTRSLRRGALQAMSLGAMTGTPVPNEVLMLYSGHTSVKSLLIYLFEGKFCGETMAPMRAAAEELGIC
jgi:hypothetical protein